MEDNSIKAVLFDLDGVLIDALDAWYSLWNDALVHFGKERISREKFENTCMELGLEENLEKLGIGSEGADYIISNAVNYVDEIKISPGALDVINSIKKPLGIATNSPPDRTDKILDKFDLWNHLDVIVHAGDVENIKPAPDQLFEACNRLNIKPENAVFVGDTHIDIEAGRAAGCKVIGLKTEADIEIDSLTELPEIINNFKAGQKEEEHNSKYRV